MKGGVEVDISGTQALRKAGIEAERVRLNITGKANNTTENKLACRRAGM